MSEESIQLAKAVTLWLGRGDLENAQAELARLLLMAPQDPVTRFVSGEVQARAGRTREAYEEYQAAADAFTRLGAPERVLAVQKRMLGLDAGSLEPAVRNKLALLSFLTRAEDQVASGDAEGAVETYRAAIAAFPNHTASYQHLANLFLRLGRPQDAAAQYLSVARAYHSRRMADKAKPYFQRALDVDPSNGEARAGLMPEPVSAPDSAKATSGPEGGRVASGMAPARVAEEPSDELGSLFTAADMCLAEEMFDEAKQAYEKILRLQPENVQAFESLNRARAGLGLPALPAPGFMKIKPRAESTEKAGAPVAVEKAPAPPPKTEIPKPSVSLPPRQSTLPKDPLDMLPQAEEEAAIEAPPAEPAKVPLAAPAAISKVKAGPKPKITRAQYEIKPDVLPPTASSGRAVDEDLIE